MKITMTTFAGLLSITLFAAVAGAQGIVTEESVTGTCMLGPGKPCGKDITGSVLQVMPGSKDVHAFKRDGKYMAEYYVYGHVFQKNMLLGSQLFETLGEMNAALDKAGFGQVTEEGLLAPCMLGNDKKCEGADTGKVRQIIKGVKDVHAVKENGKYFAKYYEYSYVFREGKSLGEKSFPSLGALNKHLTAEGFRAVKEGEVTGKCLLSETKPCEGAAAGKVLQLQNSKDIHVWKKGGKYAATTYSSGRVFNKKERKGEKEFKTLDGLNAYLAGEFDPK